MAAVAIACDDRMCKNEALALEVSLFNYGTAGIQRPQRNGFSGRVFLYPVSGMFGARTFSTRALDRSMIREPDEECLALIAKLRDRGLGVVLIRSEVERLLVNLEARIEEASAVEGALPLRDAEIRDLRAERDGYRSENLRLHVKLEEQGKQHITLRDDNNSLGYELDRLRAANTYLKETIEKFREHIKMIRDCLLHINGVALPRTISAVYAMQKLHVECHMTDGKGDGALFNGDSVCEEREPTDELLQTPGSYVVRDGAGRELYRGIEDVRPRRIEAPVRSIIREEVATEVARMLGLAFPRPAMIEALLEETAKLRSAITKVDASPAK